MPVRLCSLQDEKVQYKTLEPDMLFCLRSRNLPATYYFYLLIVRIDFMQHFVVVKKIYFYTRIQKSIQSEIQFKSPFYWITSHHFFVDRHVLEPNK